jgi:predicted nucleic acid-binding protein
LGLSRLRAFLRRHPCIALDTSVFIYQLEANPLYLPLTDRIFSWLERPASSAVTSTITMTELLVQPYRLASDPRVDQYFALLSTFPNLRWIAPDLEIAALAARLRALHGLRTPDALLAATAAHSGATGLITNDRAFERVPAFETLILDHLLDR